MTVLIIIAVIILLIAVLLLLPASVSFRFNGQAEYKLKYSGITVFDSNRVYKVKSKKKHTDGDRKKEEKKPEEKNAFQKLKEQKGLNGAIKYLCELLQIIIKKTVWLLKKIKFTKLCLDIIVATDNAAKTGIEYGVICTAVYPLLSFLSSAANIKYKKVNINADFDKTSTEIDFSFCASSSLLIIALAVIYAFKEYKNIQRTGENDG